MEDRCVICGEIIPESRQVCLKCEQMTNNEIFTVKNMKHCENCIHDRTVKGAQTMNEHNATEQAYKNGYKKGRAEAIKEFAKRLKAEMSFGHYIQFDQIDNLVQEMVGDEDG